MTLAVHLTLEDDSRIARDVRVAMLHLTHFVTDKGAPFGDVDQMAETLIDSYAYLGDARPNLAHAVHLRAEDTWVEAGIEIHDMGAAPGTPTQRMRYSLYEYRFPSLILLKNLVEAVSEGEPLEEVREQLSERVSDALLAISREAGGDGPALLRLQEWQSLFGHGGNHPLDVVPALATVEDADLAYQGITATVMERFQRITENLPPSPAP